MGPNGSTIQISGGDLVPVKVKAYNTNDTNNNNDLYRAFQNKEDKKKTEIKTSQTKRQWNIILNDMKQNIKSRSRKK